MLRTKIITAFLSFIFLCISIQTSYAIKSVYVISSQDYSVVQPYLIDANHITFQSNRILPLKGAVALAIWPEKELLFADYDFNSTITWVSTKDLVKVGEFNTGIYIYNTDIPPPPVRPGPGGIVVDRGKGKIYIAERTTNILHVYDWNDTNKNLIFDSNQIFTDISSNNGLFGIAIDENSGLLYTSDNTQTIHYYNTTTWALAGSFDIVVNAEPRNAVGVAIDPCRGYLYTGDFPDGSGNSYLVRTRLSDPNNHIEISAGSGQMFIGIEVDKDSGLIYCTRTDSNRYQNGLIGDLCVYDCNLHLQDIKTGIGYSKDIGLPNGPGPAGVAVGGYFAPPVRNITKDANYYNIQSAINDADNNNVNVIMTAIGCYYENLDFVNKPITLRSYAPNDWSVVDNTKILNLPFDSGGTKINLSHNSGSQISGLTISGGFYGISCNSSNNLIINRCKVENASDHGIFCNGGSAQITDTFVNNNNSGGLYDNNTNIIVDRCRIAYNGNHGIEASSGTASITNSLIYRNDGRGIYLTSISDTDIRNNTIAYNYGDGVYINWDYGDDPCIYSNIILRYGGGGSLRGSPSSFGNVNYNCIQGGWSGGTGNINVNPQFRDANAGIDNYHLLKISPCIDKGDPAFTDANKADIDNECRIMDGNSDGTTIVDIGADEFCPFDLTQNGFVNFLDFAVFAKSWQTSTGNANYNYLCDYFPDGTIDYKDLYVFCNHWLWPFDGNNIGGGEEEMMQEGTEQEFESQSQFEQSMMDSENQTPAIYLVSDVNEPNSGDEVTVQVYSDASIFCMGAGITITGDANITGAMSTADCNEYGWDPGWLTDPYIEDNWVYIEGVNWNGSDLVGTSGVVGYIKFRYNSGQVSVAITDDYGETFDINCAPVLLSGQALVFGPADSNEQ